MPVTRLCVCDAAGDRSGTSPLARKLSGKRCCQAKNRCAGSKAEGLLQGDVGGKGMLIQCEGVSNAKLATLGRSEPT